MDAKDIVLTEDQRSHLQLIEEGTLGRQQCAYITPNNTTTQLQEMGLVICNPELEVEGRLAFRLSESLIADVVAVNSPLPEEPEKEQPMNDAPKLIIEDNIPVPSVSGVHDIYDKLEVGQSVFLAGVPLKRAQAIVGNRNRKYSEPTGEKNTRGHEIRKYSRKFCARVASKDGVDGARIWRIAVD